MRKWVVKDFLGDNSLLEEKLNALEKSSRKVKEILFIEKYHYQIIYTEEDIMEIS